MSEVTFDVPRAHRWFAVELNNLAWDLLETPNRTPEQTAQMVDAAHGASYHWSQVGTAINESRAQCLLTTLYARLGEASAALRHATRSLELSQKTGDEQTPFDRATTFGGAALAYAVAGQDDTASEMHQEALRIASTFTDAEDTEVFERLYGIGQKGHE